LPTPSKRSCHENYDEDDDVAGHYRQSYQSCCHDGFECVWKSWCGLTRRKMYVLVVVKEYRRYSNERSLKVDVDVVFASFLDIPSPFEKVPT
jgi:hypothetical protein